MTANIKFVDGRLIELGPSIVHGPNSNEWDHIKIEKANQEDVFLPKCLGGQKMASYLHEALGQDVRLFYIEAEVLPGKIEGSVLGIEMASGKRYSTSNELDSQIALFKSMLFKKTMAHRILALTSIALICTIVLSPLGIIILGGWYKTFKVVKVLRNGIAATPNGAEFAEFFSRNSRQFRTVEPALGAV